MTLPTSGSLSMLQVLDELRTMNPGRGLPISLGDADVRSLAGVPSGDISMSQLYGKSAGSALVATGNNDYGVSSSDGRSGTVSAYPSVSYSGGQGAKTFQWSVLSAPANVTLSNANSAQCTVSRSFARDSSGRAVVYLRCVVSDTSGSVTVDNIIAELEWARYV